MAKWGTKARGAKTYNVLVGRYFFAAGKEPHG